VQNFDNDYLRKENKIHQKCNNVDAVCWLRLAENTIRHYEKHMATQFQDNDYYLLAKGSKEQRCIA